MFKDLSPLLQGCTYLDMQLLTTAMECKVITKIPYKGDKYLTRTTIFMPFVNYGDNEKKKRFDQKWIQPIRQHSLGIEVTLSQNNF